MELSQTFHLIPTNEACESEAFLQMVPMCGSSEPNGQPAEPDSRTGPPSIFYRTSSPPKQILKDKLKKMRKARPNRVGKNQVVSVTSSKVSGGK